MTDFMLSSLAKVIKMRRDLTLIWRPFRNAETKAPINPDHTLTIPLNAFASDLTLSANSISPADTTTIVTIPFLTLANYLTTAQERDTRRRNFAGTANPLMVGARKRRRMSTPPEAISAEDERAWKRKERLIEEKMEREDETWRN
ncbi:MAG: hypothetical protein M1839_002777 [Geoglossum umbratile]|nr:MAG: hypothetical protein M1839_002777 [Geoglossum umbratile]